MTKLPDLTKASNSCEQCERHIENPTHNLFTVKSPHDQNLTADICYFCRKEHSETNYENLDVF